MKDDLNSLLNINQNYSVTRGYIHLTETPEKVIWARSTWSRFALPRHSFILWTLRHHRIPTKIRLAKFIPNISTQCNLCQSHEEDEEHLFSLCSYATALWEGINRWWPISDSIKQKLSDGSRLRLPRNDREILVAIYAAYVYHIWHARNMKIFKNCILPAAVAARNINEQLIQKLLFLNRQKARYSLLIDRLLRV